MNNSSLLLPTPLRFSTGSWYIPYPASLWVQRLSLCLRLQKAPAQLFRIFPWGSWLQPRVAWDSAQVSRGKPEMGLKPLKSPQNTLPLFLCPAQTESLNCELPVCAQNQRCPPGWRKWQRWVGIFPSRVSVPAVPVASEAFCYFLTAIFYILLFFLSSFFCREYSPTLN